MERIARVIETRLAAIVNSVHWNKTNLFLYSDYVLLRDPGKCSHELHIIYTHRRTHRRYAVVLHTRVQEKSCKTLNADDFYRKRQRNLYVRVWKKKFFFLPVIPVDCFLIVSRMKWNGGKKPIARFPIFIFESRSLRGKNIMAGTAVDSWTRSVNIYLILYVDGVRCYRIFGFIYLIVNTSLI